MEKPTEDCVPCMPYAVITLASVTGINDISKCIGNSFNFLWCSYYFYTNMGTTLSFNMYTFQPFFYHHSFAIVTHSNDNYKTCLPEAGLYAREGL